MYCDRTSQKLERAGRTDCCDIGCSAASHCQLWLLAYILYSKNRHHTKHAAVLYYSIPGQGEFVTSRLGTGKSLTFFNNAEQTLPFFILVLNLNGL